jgi:hypothetical protein
MMVSLLQTRFLNCAWVKEAFLRLTGHDHARGILRRGLEHLAGKEHHRQLDDREQQSEKQRRDQRELDRGGTAAVTAKSAQDVCCGGGGQRHRGSLRTREGLPPRITRNSLLKCFGRSSQNGPFY